MTRDAMEHPSEHTLKDGMETLEDLYVCVGICQIDPDSGYCLGCGRPPLPIAAPANPTDSESRQEPAVTA